MPLVHKPHKIIGKFRGHEIILQSLDPVADDEKFEMDAKAFTDWLHTGFGGIYGDVENGSKELDGA